MLDIKKDLIEFLNRRTCFKKLSDKAKSDIAEALCYSFDVFPHEHSLDNHKKEYSEFWKPIVEKNGKLNKKQVMKELADFAYVMHQLSIVYCHITDSKLSKPMYPAHVITSEADECAEEHTQEAIKDEKEVLYNKIMGKFVDGNQYAYSYIRSKISKVLK